MGPASVPTLIRAVESAGEQDVPLALRDVFAALASFGPEARDATPVMVQRLKGEFPLLDEGENVLVAIGAPASEALAKAAKSDDTTRRALSLSALARIGRDDAVPVIVDALKDSDLFVQETAARSLAMLAERPRAADALARALKDGDGEVRVGAALTVAALADPTPKHAQALMPLLSDPNARVRRAAALAALHLTKASMQPVPGLRDALRRLEKDPEWSVRQALQQ